MKWDCSDCVGLFLWVHARSHGRDREHVGSPRSRPREPVMDAATGGRLARPPVPTSRYVQVHVECLSRLVRDRVSTRLLDVVLREIDLEDLATDHTLFNE